MIPVLQINNKMNHRKEEKSPTIPVWETISVDPWGQNRKCSPNYATIAKRPSRDPLASPPLRRTKSLPTFFRPEDGEESKSLFWFLANPQRPLSESPAVTPPRKREEQSSPIKSKYPLRRHRRHKTSPDPFIPKELDLPTLKEEDTCTLQPAFFLQDSSTTTTYSDDEEEEDLDLRGLSLLEERDE